jgi:hypothetical protein
MEWRQKSRNDSVNKIFPHCWSIFSFWAYVSATILPFGVALIRSNRPMTCIIKQYNYDLFQINTVFKLNISSHNLY